LQTALHFYKGQLWLEEVFGDTNKHAFDLEFSMLTAFCVHQDNPGRCFLLRLVLSGARTMYAGFIWLTLNIAVI